MELGKAPKFKIDFTCQNPSQNFQNKNSVSVRDDDQEISVESVQIDDETFDEGLGNSTDFRPQIFKLSKFKPLFKMSGQDSKNQSK